jgi:ATP-dependent DNA helicase RecG
MEKTAEKKKSTTQSATQSSDSVVRLLGALDRGPLSSAEIRDRLNLKHRPTLRKNYLHPALEKGYIEMTIPEKPQSRLQKYRLTEKGSKLLHQKNQHH